MANQSPVISRQTSPSPFDECPPTKATGGDQDHLFSVTQDQPAARSSATVIGAYDILDQIGHGGMADVYRGRNRKTGQLVAIKLVKGTAEPTDKMLQLFAREASLLSQLQHPRIVRCIEFGLHIKQPFIVMELIPIIDMLATVANLSPPARIKTSCWIASRVLQALHYAHAKGIVHRDVKPGNIMAYREAHRLQVKLGDFGLAKCFENAGFSGLTDDLSVRGTIAYMAPEQLRNAREVTPVADLFSTGACLYRLLVGAHPKMTASGAAFSSKEFAAAKLPTQLGEIVAQSMQHDVKKRFQNAKEFEESLQEFHGR